MVAEDFDRFHEGMVGVMSFYGKDLSRFALDVWWNALKGYELSAVINAFNRWLTNPDAGQFAPKPSDVIRMLGGRSDDQALTAWAKVSQAVRRVGTYESVVFDDPLIHRVIHEMGGWPSFGTKTEDEWPFVAREFENRYRGYVMRGETPEYLPVMVGLFEMHNANKGLKVEAPRLIGDAQKAERVMLGGMSGVSLIGRGVRASEAVLRLIAGVQEAGGKRAARMLEEKIA